MNRIAQRLELRIDALDARRHVAHLLHFPEPAAREMPFLDLVGQQEVPEVVVLRAGQEALVELWLRDHFVLGAGKSLVLTHFGQLVIRYGIDDVAFQDVTADQVLVVGDPVPLIDVTGKDVADIDAVFLKLLAPVGLERGAEQRLLAADVPDLAALRQNGCAPAVGTDTGVRAERPLPLRETDFQAASRRSASSADSFRASNP